MGGTSEAKTESGESTGPVCGPLVQSTQFLRGWYGVSMAAFHIIWLHVTLGFVVGRVGKGVGITRLWKNSLNVMLEF